MQHRWSSPTSNLRWSIAACSALFVICSGNAIPLHHHQRTLRQGSAGFVHGISHRIGSCFHRILHFSRHERQMRSVRTVDDDHNTAFVRDITDRFPNRSKNRNKSISDQKSCFRIFIQALMMRSTRCHGKFRSANHFGLDEDRLGRSGSTRSLLIYKCCGEPRLYRSVPQRS